ncbi:HAD-IA family hydrolase [Colwellia asteriadis]|uniref:HAD-IA family hydrolase n=1 Tax=Colwellia asteriadis TaxID=517723 RepID=A0ABN1LAM7_9GAMM
MTNLLSGFENHVLNHHQVLVGDLSGIIFDLDNTLVTSSLDFAEIKAELNCPEHLDVLSFVASLPIEQQHAASEKIVEFEMADAHSSSLLAGTREILALLTSLNLPFAIVTRNCKAAAQVKLTKNDLTIDLVLTREEHKAKPAPDALLHIANLWRCPPEKLLYVGDYLYDIQAAKNANMPSCLLTFGEQPPYAHLATLVAQDLSELNKALTIAFSDVNH